MKIMAIGPEPYVTTHAYDDGINAGSTGVEFWRNPYSAPTGMTSNKEKFQQWFAGWCHGKMIAEDIRNDA